MENSRGNLNGLNVDFPLIPKDENSAGFMSMKIINILPAIELSPHNERKLGLINLCFKNTHHINKMMPCGLRYPILL